MHDLVRKQIEQRIVGINAHIEWVREEASEAAKTLSTSDERIQEMVDVRDSYQELLDA